MSNETVITGIAHPTDVYSDAITAALVQQVVCVPLIYKEDLPENTTIKYVKKNGYLTSTTSAEAEVSSYSTNSAWTTTGIAITAIKDVCSSFVSVEALQFGRVDPALIAREQAAALGRRLDLEILALFPGLTNLVDAISTMTVDDVLDAAYNVRVYCKQATKRKLTAVLGIKAVHEIEKEIVKSGASVYTIPGQITLLGGANNGNPANGYFGELPGVEVFGTTGHSTSGGDDIQAVFDRDITFAGIYAPSVKTFVIETGQGNPSFGVEVSSYLFHGVSEWNDYGGCELHSDS